MGLGVFLEERTSLQHILDFDPLRGRRKADDAVEHVCHDYGVIFVVFGIVIEIFAWLVKIPNEVLDTYGIEFSFVNFAAFVATVGAILQIKFLTEIYIAHSKNKKHRL